MNPIQPVGTQGAQGAPVQGVRGGSGSGAAASAGSVAISSSMSITMVQTQVDAMLESVGGGLQSDKLLRMLIALMIMQALLAQGGGDRQVALDGLLQALGQGAGTGAQTVGLHSATNVVQIQQQSTVLMTGHAALAPTEAEGDPSDSGKNLDVSG